MNSKAQVKSTVKQQLRENLVTRYNSSLSLAVNVTLSLAPLFCKVQNHVEIVVGNLKTFSRH